MKANIGFFTTLLNRKLSVKQKVKLLLGKLLDSLRGGYFCTSMLACWGLGQIKFRQVGPCEGCGACLVPPEDREWMPIYKDFQKDFQPDLYLSYYPVLIVPGIGIIEARLPSRTVIIPRRELEDASTN